MNTLLKICLSQITVMLLALTSSYALASTNLVNVSQVKQDNDAFILYKYSMIDAKTKSSPEIAKSSASNNITYSFNNHSLSCGTKMKGTITKAISGDSAHFVGEFEVNNNEYGISQLNFDFTETGKKTRIGAMSINERTIDVKQFDSR